MMFSFKDWECRHTLAFLGFLGFVMLYAMRVNLSMSIVAMTKDHITNRSLPAVYSSCPVPVLSQHEEYAQSTYGGKKFEWDERTRGKILGSFFYGYILTNLLGGRLSEQFGGRLVFGLGVSLTALLTLISPLAACHSSAAFMVVRILEGMTEGVTYPSFIFLASHWVPSAERSRFLSRTLGGTQFGTVLTLAISGVICESAVGWPGLFYICGVLGLVWSYFWFNLIYDDPSGHPSMSASERNFLQKALEVSSRPQAVSRVPWKEICTSLPFLAVVAAHFGCNWGFYCLLTELPSYLNNIHHFSLRKNGFLSALPYLSMFVFSIVYATWIDYSVMLNKLSLRTARLISTAIGMSIPAAALLLVSSFGCNSLLVTATITLAVASTGATYSGFHCAFQELAPNFSGTLTGISNTFATIPGILAPQVTGFLINNQQTITQWQSVFELISALYVVCGLTYMAFMSVHVQPWNENRLNKEDLKPVKVV